MEASESSATWPVSTEKSRANNRIYPEFPDLNLVDSLSLSLYPPPSNSERSFPPPFKKNTRGNEFSPSPCPRNPSEGEPRERVIALTRANFISRRLFDVSSLFGGTRDSWANSREEYQRGVGHESRRKGIGEGRRIGRIISRLDSSKRATITWEMGRGCWRKGEVGVWA